MALSELVGVVDAHNEEQINQFIDQKEGGSEEDEEDQKLNEYYFSRAVGQHPGFESQPREITSPGTGMYTDSEFITRRAPSVPHHQGGAMAAKGDADSLINSPEKSSPFKYNQVLP